MIAIDGFAEWKEGADKCQNANPQEAELKSVFCFASREDNPNIVRNVS